MSEFRDHARGRSAEFQRRLAGQGVEVAVITDESSIAYLAGFWGHLGMEFGRPTLLVLRPDRDPVVVTPLMESEMVGAMSWVDDVRPWHDAGGDRWETVAARVLGERPPAIGVESSALPAVVRDFLDERFAGVPRVDVSGLLGEMRAIKSAFEIEIMRQAGEVAGAMMSAAEASLAEGVPEYESALAVIAAGTRKAAQFLTARGWEAFVSPLVHNLQIMQSGRDTAMVHRRASVKPLERGDPVYFCFCNMAEFCHYRLGFDRVFFVGQPTEEAARVQETAIAAQAAALAAIRPGIEARAVAQAANAVYRANGFEPGYRTGRAIGMAYLESPRLAENDRTPLAAGMTFAVDGGVSLPGRLGGRIGDSVVVTDDGYRFLTDYPRRLLVV